MASLLGFDAKQLDLLIDQFGLKQAWVNMLATSIIDRVDLHYILSEPDFIDFQPLSINLLKDLSIGEIGVLYEYCVAREDHESRKANGQFYTPDDVAAFMAAKSRLFPPGKWLDPCSGIGNLSWHLVNAQKNKEDFLVKSMVLADKDELALLIARFLLTAEFQRDRERLFSEIAPNFIVFDFLSVANDGSNSLFQIDLNSLDGIPLHDYVIVNPPYLATKAPDYRFETAKSTDLYSYFLENVIKTSRGFISITPQSFTNASKFSTLRTLLLDHFPNLTIYAFDNIPGNIFHGIKFGSTNSNTANSIRAAITVALPGPGKPRITSLFRWKTSEREVMFTKIDDFLSEPDFATSYFPKVSNIFENLYDQVCHGPKVGDLVTSGPTQHVLYVPSAPRYFISALKNPVSRVSQRKLYFRSEKDLDKAYLLMNSSLMYWWWRVRDGGMTLALETILSAPIPPFRRNSKLVAQLLESESTNKVIKRNAGADQENIKHPRQLVRKLNKWIIPEFSDLLLLTHENSELRQSEFIESGYSATQGAALMKGYKKS